MINDESNKGQGQNKHHIDYFVAEMCTSAGIRTVAISAVTTVHILFSKIFENKVHDFTSKGGG